MVYDAADPTCSGVWKKEKSLPSGSAAIEKNNTLNPVRVSTNCVLKASTGHSCLSFEAPGVQDDLLPPQVPQEPAQLLPPGDGLVVSVQRTDRRISEADMLAT